jgi:hypothetical protein
VCSRRPLGEPNSVTAAMSAARPFFHQKRKSTRSLNEVWLSPNAREEPPSDPRGVIRIARKLHLKKLVLRDGAIEQKRQAKGHNERGREPRSERGSACRYNQNAGRVSGMADESVGSRRDEVLAARRKTG